jgi:hypothetical protein
MLQRAVAIVFGQLAELDSFGKITFDRRHASRKRFTINIAE